MGALIATTSHKHDQDTALPDPGHGRPCPLLCHLWPLPLCLQPLPLHLCPLWQAVCRCRARSLVDLRIRSLRWLLWWLLRWLLSLRWLLLRQEVILERRELMTVTGLYDKSTNIILIQLCQPQPAIGQTRAPRPWPATGPRNCSTDQDTLVVLSRIFH